MADEPRQIIKIAEPAGTVEMMLPHGNEWWKDGASLHVEATSQGFRLVVDERAV